MPLVNGDSQLNARNLHDRDTFHASIAKAIAFDKVPEIRALVGTPDISL